MEVSWFGWICWLWRGFNWGVIYFWHMSEQDKDVKLDDIVSLCKRRGFIYQGSDVYGGLSGTWDYGPLGVALKRNIMNLWWRMFVDERDDMYGVDAAILMNQKVWQASGHVDTFTDPLVECLNCKTRFREDKLIDDVDKAVSERIDWSDKQYQFNKNKSLFDEYVEVIVDFITDRIDNEYRDNPAMLFTQAEVERLMSNIKRTYYFAESKQYERLREISESVFKKRLLSDAVVVESKRLISEAEGDKEAHYRLSLLTNNNGFYALASRIFLLAEAKCPVCGHKEWSEPRQFNMMFRTNVGPVDDEASISYLRPETAQGIFTNFKNVVDSFYPDLPFGIAQQGKAFRNEISPRDFVFRSREFEQMEIEYFVNPNEWEVAFEHWVEQCQKWFDALGLPEGSVHQLEVPENDRAHYSKRTIDFEFDYPIGREELMGLAYRTDFDLGNIERVAKKSMEYTIKGTNDRFVPHVIEPSFGVERAVMAVLTASYREDEQNGEKRVYLALPEHLAPVKYAVSPLLKNKPELVEKAREVYTKLAQANPGRVMWDDNGNIGKRYRRQDEIGTPYCVVIDFDTLDDDTVTVRHRDTTEQKRVKSYELLGQ